MHELQYVCTIQTHRENTRKLFEVNTKLLLMYILFVQHQKLVALWFYTMVEQW